ncbi:hypothetical protein Pint_06127 [Pistacia integerrima]|uniref:Uncharacterized protein n=1 Tax=Pistacia integerrima TaxID=434235 RepID=A0ACC0ZA54_9ROSI|nr:hypothetical protein Pint_06127 [Pistacia integerrima]
MIYNNPFAAKKKSHRIEGQRKRPTFLRLIPSFSSFFNSLNKFTCRFIAEIVVNGTIASMVVLKWFHHLQLLTPTQTVYFYPSKQAGMGRGLHDANNECSFCIL